MDKIFFRKAFSVIAIVLLMLNLGFLGFRVYSQIDFWIVLGVVGIASIIVMKYVK